MLGWTAPRSSSGRGDETPKTDRGALGFPVWWDHELRSIEIEMIDDSWRREAAAFAVVRVIQRRRPQDFEDFAARVRAGDDEAKFTIAAEWCGELNLACDSIITAAAHLALDPKADDIDAAKEAGTILIWKDSEGIHDHQIVWRPGETKKDFRARAEAHFDRMKGLEQQGGKVAASNRINHSHLEWLVRFQVGNEPITEIANTVSQARKDVRLALRGTASLLGLKLRTASPGRPRGSGRPLRRTHRFPRRSQRR